eukprot:gene7473-549_t
MWRRVLLCFGIGRREGHESSHPRPHGPLTDRDNFFAQRNIPQGHAIGANSHVPVSNNTQGVNIGAGGGNRDVSLMDSAYLRECVLQVVMDIPRAVTEAFRMPALEDICNYVESGEDNCYIEVIEAIIEALPHTNPLNKAVASLILENMSLPSMRQLRSSASLLGKILQNAPEDRAAVNSLICLSVLAEIFSGVQAEVLCTLPILDGIETLLQVDHPFIVLNALICVEMLAKTGGNKREILQRDIPNLVYMLETKFSKGERDASFQSDHSVSQSLVQQFKIQVLSAQIGFCATWLMDNVLPCSLRPVAVRPVDEKLNVMVDAADATQHLKLGPDGLEIRADVNSFESVRATCSASAGRCWYYEAIVISAGIVQIGWATTACQYQTEEGHGIGDDEHSLAIDGCRQLIWHNQETVATPLKWKPGDIVGCFVNLITNSAWFSVNGQRSSSFELPETLRDAIYPAASLMTGQHIIFNFGNQPYRYRPSDIQVYDLNQFGKLTQQQRHIMPRLVVLNEIQEKLNEEEFSDEEVCTICYVRPIEVKLEPCGHQAFCLLCSLQVNLCPLCRIEITTRKELAESINPSACDI